LISIDELMGQSKNNDVLVNFNNIVFHKKIY